MSTAALRGFVRGLVLDGPPTDAALVTRYAKLNDHSAFAELLRRHGPVVLGVCRRTLGHADADDAFQAVFLVLARKADAIRPPGSVGGWLYGVAVRTAKKAKVAAARRWRREMNAQASRDQASGGREPAGSDLDRADLRAVIDAELGRLPDKLRLPVVLCDLGGKTRGEAARELGLPDGTVAARLHQARKLLAGRLTRRGVTLPAAGLVTLAVAEPVSADLARATLAAAEAFAKGAASPAISTTAQTLAEGVVRAMNAGTWKLGLGAVLAAGLLTGGGLMWAANGPGPAGKPGPAAKPEAQVTINAPGNVTDVSFSTDGKLYAVVAGGKVTVHDAATGKVRWAAAGGAARFVHNPARELPSSDGKGGVTSIRAPAGDALWVFGPRGVTIHAAESGVTGPRRPDYPRPKTKEGWHAVRFSPDGTRYAAHFGFGVRVYDSSTGFEPVRLENQHEPGGSWVAGGNGGKDVFFSADGKKVVGVGVLVEPGNQGLAEWDAATGERVLALGAEPRSMAAALAPDGKTFAVGYADHIDIWPGPRVVQPDAADRVERGPLQRPKRVDTAGAVTALAYSPDGKTLAVGVRSAKSKPVIAVQLLDAATGKELRQLGGFASALPVTALAFSPDGKTLVAGTGTTPAVAVPDDAPKAPEVKVFALTPDPAPPPADPEPPAGPEVERNQDLWAWQEARWPDRVGPFGSVAFAPDGKTIAGATGNDVHLWDVAKRQRTGTFSGYAPAACAFSPDGRQIAITTTDKVELFDPRTAELLKTIEAKDAKPTAVAFGPDGGREGEVGPPTYRRLAFTDGRSLWATTWVDDFAPSTAFFGPLQGGGGPLPALPHAGVTYSPDGGRLVFIPNNRIDPTWPGNGEKQPDPKKATHWYAQVWGGGSGEPMAMLPHGTDPVTAVAWASDGRIATADAAGVVVIWDGKTYKERKRIKLSGPVTALTLRADGKRFAAGVMTPELPGGRGTAVRIEVVTEQDGSEPDNWQRSSTCGLPKAETVRSVAFAPDGLTMIAGTATADGKGGGLRVWDRVKLAPK